MARVEGAIEELQLHVHVVAGRGGRIAAFVQVVAGRVIVVDVDRDDHVIAALRDARSGRALLRSADDARGAKIGVEIVLVVRELEFAEIDVGVIGERRNLARRRVPRIGGVNVGNVRPGMELTERGVEVGRNARPVRKAAVDRDVLDRRGQCRGCGKAGRGCKRRSRD
jgi:hypothetical protein